MCGWSAGSTCVCSCGSWKQIAEGKFKFWVMLKSLFVNSEVQRLQFCSHGEWGAVSSNQMWLHENTNSSCYRGLALSSLTPSHTVLDFRKKSTWGRSDTEECFSQVLTNLGSRVKLSIVWRDKQKDIVSDKAAGCHWRWNFIKRYKPNYLFPKQSTSITHTGAPDCALATAAQKWKQPRGAACCLHTGLGVLHNWELYSVDKDWVWCVGSTENGIFLYHLQTIWYSLG